MSFRIEIQSGEPSGEVFDLHEGENILGRSKDSDICLLEPDVSRRHLLIRVSGNAAVSENLSQYGRTYIGQKQIVKPTPLTDGCCLRIGDKTCLIFRSVPESLGQALTVDPTYATPGESRTAGKEEELLQAKPKRRSMDEWADAVSSGVADVLANGHQTDESTSEPQSLPEVVPHEMLSLDSQLGAASSWSSLPPETGAAPEPMADDSDMDGSHTREISAEAIEDIRRQQAARERVRLWIVVAAVTALLVVLALVVMNL